MFEVDKTEPGDEQGVDGGDAATSSADNDDTTTAAEDQGEGLGSNLAKSETGETDWKATSRNWEKQAKKDFAELKKVREELAQLRKEAGSPDELEDLRQQVASLMNENAAAKREAAIAKVASDKGLTAGQVELLQGDTPEELAEYADKLLKAFGANTEQKEPDNSQGRTRVPKEKLRPGSASTDAGSADDPAEIAKAVLNSGF